MTQHQWKSLNSQTSKQVFSNTLAPTVYDRLYEIPVGQGERYLAQR